MKLKMELKVFIVNCQCLIGLGIARSKLLSIEDFLSEKLADKNAGIVKEYVNSIDNLDGKLSHNGLWKLKRKLCPRAKDPPMAKKDNDGNIITAPSLIRKLYIETYCHRLRQRKIRPR